MFKNKLCFTEKIMIGLIIFFAMKIFFNRVPLNPYGYLIVGSGLIAGIYGLLLYLISRKYPEHYNVKNAVALAAIFLLSIMFILKTPGVSDEPFFYEGYIKSNHFYTDDVETLLLFNRALANQDEDTIARLYMTGKVHITKGRLSGTFADTYTKGVVSVIINSTFNGLSFGYTFRNWTNKK